MWVGDDGALVADIYGQDPRLLDPKRDAELKANPPAEKYPRSKGVYQEWLDACKGGPPALSTFDGHAGPLTEMVLLGCLAVREGRTIDLDASTGEVKTTGIPAWYMKPEFREGWKL